MAKTKQPAIDARFAQLVGAVAAVKTYTLHCWNCGNQLASKFESGELELAIRAYNSGWRFGTIQDGDTIVTGPLCPNLKCAKSINPRFGRNARSGRGRTEIE